MSQDPNNNIVVDGTLYGISSSVQLPRSRSDPLFVVEKEGENDNDQSSFSGLPDEMIEHIFSFLPMKDRLRARVDKRTRRIEAQSQYHVGKMLIEEVSEKPIVDIESIDDDEELPEYDIIGYDERITFYKERSYSTACIRKIGLNTTIASLEVKLTGSDEFHREVFEHITDFDIEDLYLLSEGNSELMRDSLLTDVSRTCKYLHMDNAENISAEAIKEVYENMKNGSAKLRTLTLGGIKRDECFHFLNYIGIALVDGRYVIGPNTVFFTKLVEGLPLPVCPSFFHGSLEITFSDNFLFSESVDMMVDFHETRAAVDMALVCKFGMGFLAVEQDEE